MVARISGRLISSHYETRLAAAVAGIGLILTSPFVVADQIAWGVLLLLLPDYRAQPLEINALYPHRRHLSCKVRVSSTCCQTGSPSNSVGLMPKPSSRRLTAGRRCWRS